MAGRVSADTSRANAGVTGESAAADRTYEFESDGLKITVRVEVTKPLLDLRRDDRMFLNTVLDTTEE